jgi:TPR repeat protein
MKPLSEDDKRILLGLIWALKASDVSNLQSALAKPLETQVGTTRGSANDIFWSRLEGWELAEERPLKTQGLSPQEVLAVKNMKIFMLTEAGAQTVAGGMDLALNTGWPPMHAEISLDAVALLKNYMTDPYAPARRQAMAKMASLHVEGKGVEKNPDEAQRLYHEAAELGDLTALNNLGVMYFAGDGVPKDPQTALGYFQQAAELGSPGAMDNLGSMYASGLGVPQSYSEAAKWYRKAADMGRASAMCNLGDFYASGLGVPQDDLQAFIWYSLGVAFGLDARQPRDDVAANLSADQLDEARKFIGEWKPAVWEGKPA